MVKNRSLAIYHAFKIDRKAVRTDGVIHSENIFSRSINCCHPFEKNFRVRTAVVFNSEFKTIQPFEQQRFFVRQRESNKIQLSFHDALDLLQSTSLSWHIFLYRCQYIHRFFHFHCKKIDEQDAKTKLFT